MQRRTNSALGIQTSISLILGANPGTSRPKIYKNDPIGSTNDPEKISPRRMSFGNRRHILLNNALHPHRLFLLSDRLDIAVTERGGCRGAESRGGGSCSAELVRRWVFKRQFSIFWGETRPKIDQNDRIAPITTLGCPPRRAFLLLLCDFRA